VFFYVFSFGCKRIYSYFKFVLDRLKLNTHTNSIMNKIAIFSAVLVALFCVNTISADSARATCECTCNIPSKKHSFRPSYINTIVLEDAVCDNRKCLAICNEQYPFCESGKAIMAAVCKVA